MSRTELYIRNHSSAVGIKRSAHTSTRRTAKRKMLRLFTRSRKRLVRYSLLAANAALLFIVVFFVAKAPTSSQALHQNAVTGSSSEVLAGPLDQVSSADIAVNIARVASMPEAVSVVNHADSVSAIAATAAVDTSVVAKPQILSAALPSRKDIQTYTVVAGDTVSSIATKIGVSSDSIRWSNDITGTTVAAGRVLKLPPSGTNGIIYMVADGDTPEKLAQKYSTDKDLIVSFNDAEVSGLKPGETIVIPNGIVAAPVPAASPTTNPNTNPTHTYYAFAGGGGYDRGWCTDYASRQGGAPGNWGNANTWAILAARTPGWTVSSTPRAGAIAQTSAGWAGHVGIVDDVSEDGTMIKYSDMNGLAGFGRVGYSGWVPIHSAFQNFIFRE